MKDDDVTTIDEQLSGMSAAELDGFPLGIIRLDRAGKILYYNASQAQFAQRSAATTIGLNFFRDVAPCTAVRAFEGRFNDFASGTGSSIEPFDFLFAFPWGRRKVTITMVRDARAHGEFYIVVNVVSNAA